MMAIRNVHTVNNTKLDYVVTDLTTHTTNTVTTLPINTRYMFHGGFIGDYTDMAVGSDNVAIHCGRKPTTRSALSGSTARTSAASWSASRTS